jgi:hypothetical protein
MEKRRTKARSILLDEAMNNDAGRSGWSAFFIFSSQFGYPLQEGERWGACA